MIILNVIVIWQINEQIHKSTSMKDPQEVARFARSTRAWLVVQAREKTPAAEQRMIDIIEHVITVLRGPAGQKVGVVSLQS